MFVYKSDINSDINANINADINADIYVCTLVDQSKVIFNFFYCMKKR